MLLRLVTRLTAGIVIALAPDGAFPARRRNFVLSKKTNRRVATLWLGLLGSTAGATIVSPTSMFAQQEIKTDELTRKPKTKVSPVYPELAKRMSITGTVRLSVVVSANGQVKNAKPIGGHPILVTAAMDAMKQWRFEPAAVESSGVVEFKFQRQ
jgi:TonB family protein